MINGNPDIAEIVLAVVGPLGALGFLYGVLTLAFKITIGDDIQLRTLTGLKHFSFNDVGNIDFEIQQGRVWRIRINHDVMSVKLKNRRNPYFIMVTKDERAQLENVLSAHNLPIAVEEQTDTP